MSSQTPSTLYTPPLSGGSDPGGSFVLVNVPGQEGYGNGSLGSESQEPSTLQESSDVEVDATFNISSTQSNRPQPRPRPTLQSPPVANRSRPEGVGTISMSDITIKIDTAASENARLRGRLEENNELLDSKLGQFQHHLETKVEEMARLRQEVSHKEQLEGEVTRLQSELSTARDDNYGLRRRLQETQEDSEVSHLRQQIADLQLKLQSVPPVPKPRTNLPSTQSLTFQMEALQGEKRVLTSEKRDLEGKMEELENRAAELEQQLQLELESRIVVDDDLRSANDRIRDLNSQLRAQAVSVPTGESFEQLHQRNQELVAQLTNLKSQVMQAQATANENERLHASARSLTSQMETLQREKQVLTSEKRELEGKMKELESRTVEQEQKLQHVSVPIGESYERLHQQNQELVAQLTQLKPQMAQAQATASENRRLRDEVAANSSQIAAKESRIQTLSDLNRQVEVRCAELDKRVVSLQEEVQRKAQELREEKSRKGSEGEAEVPQRQGHTPRPAQGLSHKRIEVRLNEALTKVQTLEQENAFLREEKDSLDQQVRVEMTREVEEKNRELAQFQRAKDEAAEAFSREKEERDRLQQQNSLLLQEITGLRQTKEMEEEAFSREKEEAVERALDEQKKVKEEAEQVLGEQLAQLQQQYEAELAEKDKQIKEIAQKCIGHEEIKKQISEEAESEIKQLRHEIERQKSDHESEKQRLHHLVRGVSTEKDELGQVVEEYRRESETQYQELSAQIIQLQHQNADQQQQFQQERASFTQQRDAEIAAYTHQIKQKDVEMQRMDDLLEQLKREKKELEDCSSLMNLQMEEYNEGFQRERKAREEMAEAKEFLENSLRGGQKQILDLRRRCTELSARLQESEGSELFDGATDLTSSWADLPASSPMGPDPRQTFRGPPQQLNTTFPPQNTMFSPTSPSTQPPGNFPQQSTPVRPRYLDEQQWQQEPPLRARLQTEVEHTRPELPRDRASTFTDLHGLQGQQAGRAFQQEHPFAQSDNFGHQFTHGHPQQFQPVPVPPQEHAVRFDLPNTPPQPAPNAAIEGGAQWVAVDAVVDANAPTGACPLCGRSDFKTQTEYLIHCARCDP